MVKDRLRSTLLAHSRWRNARWLVIAPHADDETLGCGALIVETAASGRFAGVAFLTDGGGSHRCEDPQAHRRIVDMRKYEARAALRVLAPGSPSPLFLGWPDAKPHAAMTPPWHASMMQLASLCSRRQVDAIAVTGHEEPHCDHLAACELAYAVAAKAARPTVVFEYIVWAPFPPGSKFSVVRTAPLAPGRRHAALSQHRSQLTPLFGEGFRVPTAMRRMPASDLLYTQARR